GWPARFVSVPPLVDFCFVVHCALPVEIGATPFAYVTVTVLPAFLESESTVIVRLATETLPASAVTWPAPAPVCGAVQPVGTSMVTAPFVIPPVGTVYVTVSRSEVLRVAEVGATRGVPEPADEMLHL